MKKIWLFLGLVIVLISCGRPVETKNSYGVIEKIYKKDNEVYIEVIFKNSYSNLYYSFWFVGSDTCRVGQTVRLK